MATILKFAVFGVIFLPVLAAAQETEDTQENCKVTLQNGTVFGILSATLNPKKNVCAYMAIPYANPPVGALRFQPPETLSKNWGSLNATNLPNWCPQSDKAPAGVKISEDCLYLNVFQPQNVDQVDSAGLPVMIWFHGGGFTAGSSLPYTPGKLLARGDVILVVVHYRLGMLGFFSTGDSTVPGNNGLKDQAFSIRWVNENIKAFNGNPNKVTIFGESAGGASVMFQLVSPLNTGLIHGVISQSGTAIASWSFDRNPAHSAKLMAKRLGCPDLTSLAMVACLRNISWERLVKEQKSYQTECYKNMTNSMSSMTPVIEPKDTPGALITEDPADIMKSGTFADVPVMIGANKHDGSFVLASLYLAKFGPEKLDSNAEYMKQGIVPDLLKFLGEPEQEPGNRAVASSVELAYLNGVNRSSWTESMPGLVDLISVMGFKSSVQNSAELLSARNRSVYLYSFEHHSHNTLWPLFFGNLPIPVNPGIAHADELIYLFNMPLKLSTQDTSFSEVMVDLWLNFAKTGNPTPKADERFETWTRYDSLNESYLKLNLTPSVLHGHRNSWRPNGFEWN